MHFSIWLGCAKAPIVYDFKILHLKNILLGCYTPYDNLTPWSPQGSSLIHLWFVVFSTKTCNN